MIKLNPTPTFKAKVKITLPGADAPGVLDITYQHKGVKALADWWAEAAKQPLHEALGGIVRQIDGLHNEAGEPVAYSEAVLLQFLDQYHAAGAEILNAYFKELTEARAKN